MFDEQPDGDPHGECAAEIARLNADNSRLREALEHIQFAAMDITVERSALSLVARDAIASNQPGQDEVDRLPELPTNLEAVLRRIRRCESEVPAQLVLEHAIRTFATEAIAAERAEVVRLMGDLRASEEEQLRLRGELGKYASVFNWDVDDRGIRRVWLEPDSTTPSAYNGFESARAALATPTQGGTQS